MRCAVTGGSGVVGAAVVRDLVAAGHRVSALARSEASARKLSGLGAEPVPGDVLDPGSLEGLVTGADWVFNVAGVNELCSPDPDHMDRVNVVGSWNVLQAARRFGAGRMVHTSSAVAVGEPKGEVGSEVTVHRGWYLSRYERSKHLSEEMLLGGAGDFDLVVVNPSSVQGPGRATGTGKLILDVLTGRLGLLVETVVSLVDIDDCAAGHRLAAERGLPGERYLLSGASVSVSQAIDVVSEQTGIEPGARFVPGALVTVGAAGTEAAAAVLHRRPALCRELARVLLHGHRYDGSRAEAELGLAYRPLEETIARTVAWFRAEGLLPAHR